MNKHNNSIQFLHISKDETLIKTHRACIVELCFSLKKFIRSEHRNLLSTCLLKNITTSVSASRLFLFVKLFYLLNGLSLRADNLRKHTTCLYFTGKNINETDYSTTSQYKIQ